MDKNQFFREATLRICGNLEIEQALHSVLLFFQEKMPVDRMSLQLYEKRLKAVRTIAMASPDGAKEVDFLTPLSREAQHQIEERIRLQQAQPHLYLINNHTPQIYQEMFRFHGIEATSFVVLPLNVGERYVGSLTLISENEVFSQEQVDWIALLKEPFVIALSNTLRYHEVVRLKNLLKDDNRYLFQEIRHLTGDEIIGANFGLKEVMNQVQRVAALDSPVLLLGETGAGKDVIANAIHYSSARKDGPFVKVNCGAIPDSLIDSELFGHEKGAFTGALTQKRGRFERADKGTVFLDEIGELPLQAQSRLLRVLQHKEIERVGGSKTIQLDIRFIAATNRDLQEMVRNNQFREDLFFRLSVFPIRIPPLRERVADIPALAQYFISKKSRELKLPGTPHLAADAVDRLTAYHWPGNVRELENVVERALILNPEGPLRFDDLLQMSAHTPAAHAADEDWRTLDAMTADYIRRVLSKTNGRINGKGGAAEILGIHPNTLRHRLRKLGIVFGRK
ncbi:sigma-54 interaction domain-containing protein [Calditrichota bacterium GD2]